MVYPPVTSCCPLALFQPSCCRGYNDILTIIVRIDTMFLAGVYNLCTDLICLLNTSRCSENQCWFNLKQHVTMPFPAAAALIAESFSARWSEFHSPVEHLQGPGHRPTRWYLVIHIPNRISKKLYSRPARYPEGRQASSACAMRRS
jgi:hypothetical protein